METKIKDKIAVCPIFRAAEIIAHGGGPSTDLVRDANGRQPYDPIQVPPIPVQRCIKGKCALWDGLARCRIGEA